MPTAPCLSSSPLSRRPVNAPQGGIDDHDAVVPGANDQSMVRQGSLASSLYLHHRTRSSLLSLRVASFNAALLGRSRSDRNVDSDAAIRATGFSRQSLVDILEEAMALTDEYHIGSTTSTTGTTATTMTHSGTGHRPPHHQQPSNRYPFDRWSSSPPQ